MTKATLYYDIVSPWSFLAYTGAPGRSCEPCDGKRTIRLTLAEHVGSVLKRYRQPWDMQLELKPMFLGGVMQASGNKP